MKLMTYFSNSGSPSTGLSPTMDIWTHDGSVVESAQAMIEIAGGFYYYDFTTYNGGLDYVFRADGGAGLSDTDRYQSNSNELASVWQEKLNDHKSPMTTGYKMKHFGGGFFPIKDVTLTKKEKEKLFGILDNIYTQTLSQKPLAKEITTIRELFGVITNNNKNIKVLIEQINTIRDMDTIEVKNQIASSKESSASGMDNIKKAVDGKISQMEDKLKALADDQNKITEILIKTLPDDVLEEFQNDN